MRVVASLLSQGQSMESFSEREWRQRQCDEMNAREKPDAVYQCGRCKNKGVIFRVSEDGGEIVAVPCQCKGIRESILRMRRSGLEGTIHAYTFESYRAKEPWQQKVVQTAQSFLEQGGESWFYIGGQVGSGKSHICTAIARELLLRGKETRYFPWREVVRLKGTLNSWEYQTAMDALKDAEVLYIDDLFKGGSDDGRGNARPTQADINIAFELVNHRYLNRKLITILSSERMVEELLQIDQAVGSRIYERSKGFCIGIPADPNKNYRMEGSA